MVPQKIKKQFTFFFFLLIIQINSFSTHNIIHENSAFPKVISLEDQNVLIFSSIIGENRCIETKFDKNGEKIYSYIYHNLSLSAKDSLVVPNNNINKESILIHNDNFSNLIIKKLNKGNLISSLNITNKQFHFHKSVVSLKCGKIIIASIYNDNEIMKINLNLYNSQINSIEKSISFGEYAKYISCYEQKENQVYCIYITEKDSLVSNLNIQHIEVNPISNTIILKESQIIKSFFALFNYLKALPLNETQAFILLRTKNDRYNSTSQNLFYYFIELSSEKPLVKLIKANFIDSDCIYSEHYIEETIDITLFSNKTIYLSCETKYNKIRGYTIYPGKNETNKFYFKNFGAEELRNPLFAKFGNTLGIFYNQINHNNESNIVFHLVNYSLCNDNCEECSNFGSDENNQCDSCKEGFYFFYNQTKGNGIPGSCHDNCINNGFFIKNSEGIDKCHPCLKGCKKCKDENTCDECYKPFYLSHNKNSCVEDCGYCYAKDNTSFNVWQCINCKTAYSKEKYNLNGTCYDEIPLITYKDKDVFNKSHHIINEQCNLLMGCKDGCFKCNPWYSEKCTECIEGYYQEDFYSLVEPDNFHCFKEKECQGLVAYQFDETLKIGGVPKIIEGKGVCYNCRLREENYRQVENNFICGPKPKRTYIDIPHYNKVSNCYIRCASCEKKGNGIRNNCLSCRDPAIFTVYYYDSNSKEGDCRCSSCKKKCGNYPYYHDYDLEDKLGIYDGSCGADCDVCLNSPNCPENYPFLVKGTRECVELCGVNEILYGTCLLNHTKALEIVINELNEISEINGKTDDEMIKKIIEVSIVEKYASQLNINKSTIKDSIDNYIDNGKIFNLPNNEIILGNNMSIELTTNELELLKLLNSKDNNNNKTKNNSDFSNDNPSDIIIEEKKFNNSFPNNIIPISSFEDPSIISNLTECEKILKKVYNLPDDEKLIILNRSSLKEYEKYFDQNLSYVLFSTSLMKFLSLEPCKNINTIITDSLNVSNLIAPPEYQAKIKAVLDNGYDVFDINSNFYNDICTPFTNENGNDVLLDDRRRDYYFENLNLCKNGCNFIGYNITNNYYSCECPIGNIDNEEINKKKEMKNNIPKNFYEKHTNSNIKIFKCFSQVFSSQGQKNNFGSFILLLCLTSFIGIIIFYIIKGQSLINKFFSIFLHENEKVNPPKNIISEDKINPTLKSKLKNKLKHNNKKYSVFKDINKEDISCGNLYWSLLKNKQLIIFTFYTYDDKNFRFIKIGLFILFFSFCFDFTALFFKEEIIRNIYNLKGDVKAALNISNIILSSLCCIITNIIIKIIFLNGDGIFDIKKERKLYDSIKRRIKIKIMIFFFFSLSFIFLSWYYISAFCAIFKNLQGYYLLNVLLVLIICNIWPFVTSLIALALIKFHLCLCSPFIFNASKIFNYI